MLTASMGTNWVQLICSRCPRSRMVMLTSPMLAVATAWIFATCLRNWSSALSKESHETSKSHCQGRWGKRTCWLLSSKLRSIAGCKVKMGKARRGISKMVINLWPALMKVLIAARGLRLALLWAKDPNRKQKQLSTPVSTISDHRLFYAPWAWNRSQLSLIELKHLGWTDKATKFRESTLDLRRPTSLWSKTTISNSHGLKTSWCLTSLFNRAMETWPL